MLDKGNIAIMAHLLIRDPDQDIVLLRKRDAIVKPLQKPIQKDIKEPSRDNR